MDAIEKAAKTQLENIEQTTGKTIGEWGKIIKASGLEKHKEQVNFLKEQHGFSYGNANTVVHIANQSHAGAAENETDWIEAQYQGKENLKPWYEAIESMIDAFGNDVEKVPKKAYVSMRRKKQFAILQPSTKTRLDVGLNIKTKEPSGMAEKAGSWNTMCTHRIKVEDASALNEELKAWIKMAYEEAG